MNMNRDNKSVRSTRSREERDTIETFRHSNVMAPRLLPSLSTSHTNWINCLIFIHHFNHSATWNSHVADILRFHEISSQWEFIRWAAQKGTLAQNEGMNVWRSCENMHESEETETNTCSERAPKSNNCHGWRKSCIHNASSCSLSPLEPPIVCSCSRAVYIYVAHVLYALKLLMWLLLRQRRISISFSFSFSSICVPQ